MTHPSVIFSYDDGTKILQINNHQRLSNVNLSIVPGTDFSAARLEQIRQAAQTFLFDNVTAISSLVEGNPDKTTDPATDHGERMFWDNGNVISREFVVEDVTWDGNTLNFTIRRL